MPWDPPELPDDEDEVSTRILDGLAAALPGWEPVEGAPEVALAEEIGRETVQVATTAGTMLELAVAALGQTAFGFPAYAGVAATVAVDITVTGPGAVIPAGFAVVGLNEDGTEVAFTLDEPITSTGTTVAAVLTAVTEGVVGNTVPAGDLSVITATATVLAVTATGASQGGADAEELTDYLGRLVDYFATLRPGGVRANDLALLARSVPGVHRALGVDLYDPDNPTVDTERTATVFPIDENNYPVSPDVADAVQARLEESREVNFVIHVAEPTYTAVAVEYAVTAAGGVDHAALQTAINTAVLAWLASWGTTTTDDEAWVAAPVVRYLDLARVIGSVVGVAALTSVTLNGGTADVALADVAGLPAPPDYPGTPSTVTGTVS